MNPPVAIITGASQGIGAGLVAGYRGAGYSVVGVARSLPAADDSEYVAIAGDIADPETARRAVDRAIERFGRIDTLVNNAGIYIEKPFTEYTVEDYVAITAVNLTGFFHITQLAIEQMLPRRSGHIVNISTSLGRPRRQQAARRAARPDQGGPGRGQPFAGDRVRLTRRPRQRRVARRNPDTGS